MKVQKFLKSSKSIAAGLLLLLPLGAQAGLVVEVEDLVGLTTETRSDNTLGEDSNPLAGQLLTSVFSGTGVFNFIATSGAPDIHTLNDTQINANFSGVGQWRISVFDDSYIAAGDNGLFRSAITPTTLPLNVTASVETYVNGVLTFSSGQLFDEVDVSGMGWAGLSDGLPFTIEHRYLVTANGAAQMSYDTETVAVPEPETLGLLGFALMGLALVRRKYQAV